MGQNIAGYIRLLRDCGREVTTLNSYDIPLVNDILRMKLYFVEDVCVRLSYGLNSQIDHHHNTAEEIAEIINRSIASGKADKSLHNIELYIEDNRIPEYLEFGLQEKGFDSAIDAYQVRQIITEAVAQLHDVLDVRYRSAKIELEWLSFTPRTQKALNRSRYQYVYELFDFEQRSPLTEIDDIGNKGAIEIYDALLTWYQPSEFKHYQAALQLAQYDPYEALLYDLFGNPCEPFDEKIPSFARSLIDKEISGLDSKEAYAIRKHYGLDSGYKMPYQQIGNLYLNATKERVRQIIAKGLRKLRFPSRSKHFIFLTWSRDELLRNYAHVEELHADAVAKLREAHRVNREIEKQIRTARSSCLKQRRDYCPIYMKAPFEVDKRKEYLQIEIGALDLPVRPHNCLIRSGAQTVGDIFKMKYSGLMSVRHMGQKSAAEVIEKLREYFPEDDPIWVEFME